MNAIGKFAVVLVACAVFAGCASPQQRVVNQMEQMQKAMDEMQSKLDAMDQEMQAKLH